MITKTELAVAYWNKGERTKALSIFKTFKMGLTKQEQECVRTAYEIATGREQFYTQIGIDAAATSLEADSIIKRIFISPPARG